MKNWIKIQFRKKTRVYIFPTKMGGYLLGLIFLLFLLSIGYNNNLLLIFTLFLFSFNLLWLVQTHFHLHNLKLKSVILGDGHANEGIPLKVLWSKSPKGPVNWKVILESKDEQVHSTLYEQNEESSLGECKLPKRGVMNWCHLKVVSSNPFGLYNVWCFYPLKLTTYVYPSILKDYGLPEIKNDNAGETIPMMKAGHEDIWNLAPYQGEESRKISWKHYARSGELLIKEGEEFSDPVLFIKLNIPEKTKEHYLSELASQMVYCQRKGIPFIFESALGTLGPANNQDHLNDCLKVLSLC
jgi:uncharacterized protein (DUF58 family)